MRTAWIAFIAVAVLAGPTQAAEAPVAVDADVGLRGYASDDHPFTLEVTLTADRLVSGLLRVRSPGHTFVEEIELPAATAKTYAFDLPPTSTGTSIRIEVVEDGNVLAAERVEVTVSGTVLVGVVGDLSLASTIDAATTLPFNQEITALELTPDDVTGGDLAPLHYLVLVDDCCAVAADRLGAWIEDGGRLAAPEPVLAALGLDLPTEPLPGVGARLARRDEGEVILLEAIPDTPDDWRHVLRSVPLPLLSMGGGPIQEVPQMLLEGALGAAERTPVDLPWLAGALVLYILVVGPVNFLVLRRVGRPEWAWATIPLLGVLAVAGLVGFARRQGTAVAVSHASVVVEAADLRLARSGLAYVAAGEGRHTIGFPPTVSARSSSAWWGADSSATVGTTPEGGTTLTFDLPTLGVAAMLADWRPEPSGVSLTSERREDVLEVTVENRGTYAFWLWGLAVGPEIAVADGALAAGGTDTVTVETTPRRPADPWSLPFVDVVLQHADPASELDWVRTGPLAFAANALVHELGVEAFFFGFTDELTLSVEADGRTVEAPGKAVVLVAADLATPTTEVVGILLGTDGNVEFVGDRRNVFVWQPDRLDLRYVVPPDTTLFTPTYLPGGPPNRTERLEVYDWRAGTFRDVAFDEPLRADRYASPTGEVMVRVRLADAEELFTGSFALEVEVP
ncbi:MAG TPA: hypothetical protein ENK55_08195 [Actinobacteria bacterium]|nr:hypothetical protein [Actinomycetota bacterium]